MTEPAGTPQHILDRSHDNATGIGHLVLESARLQWSLGQLLAALVEPSNPALGLAIWNAIKSDRSQRDILEAAAKVSLAHDQNAMSDVQWLLEQANSRAPYRNDAVHTAFFFETGDDGNIRLVPDALSNPGRLQRLSDDDLPTLFARHRDDLTALYRYADKLTDHFVLTGDEQPPLPERPQLPSNGRPRNRTESDRQNSAKQPEPQLRSSRE
jgi:hypothetical protein